MVTTSNPETSNEGITIFEHSQPYIKTLLHCYGFEQLKVLKFLVWHGRDDDDDLFDAYVAQGQSKKLKKR